MPRPPLLTRLRRGLAVDLGPLRESRDLRLLVVGSLVTGLGTQATLVALPYQLYVQTRSPALTGLLGLFELVPLVLMSLYGGALADRTDRRRMLLYAQTGLVVLSAALAVAAYAEGEPPLWFLYAVGALLAGGNGVQSVVRSAIVPNVVAPDRLRQALALSFGLTQVTLVVGPALGGVLIAVDGVGLAYALDAVTCLGMVATVLPLSPQLPRRVAGVPDEPILRSIADGLRFVRSRRALLGSFAIDLSAMTFGMPRTLFPVLSLAVYDAGATGTGLLNAAVSVGAVVAALTTGWLGSARRLGRIVIVAVIAWGLAIAGAGLVSSIVLAMLLLAVAGAADSVSAVCRSTINQTITPDAMRGRMSSVFSLVVQSGPRLGDVEGGAVASIASPRFSVVSGGLACIVGAVVIAVAVPSLAAYDQEEAEAERASWAAEDPPSAPPAGTRAARVRGGSLAGGPPPRAGVASRRCPASTPTRTSSRATTSGSRPSTSTSSGASPWAPSATSPGRGSTPPPA